VALARDLGFSAILAGEHRLSVPYPYCAPFPFLGRLAADSGEMLLVAMNVLPLHNPIDVAEAGATLDAISGGRLVLVGALGYREIEYQAFGVAPATRVRRMVESLEVLEMLWRNDEAAYDGRFYHVPQTAVSTRPVQPGGPPIWLAAVSDNAVTRAARLGYPWLILSHASAETLRRQSSMYREAFTLEHGAAPATTPIIQELVINTNAEAAWDTAERFLGSKYRAYSEWGQGESLPGSETFEQPFRDLARDRFIIGTPDECLRAIERIRDTLAVDFLFIHCHWPGLRHAETEAMIDLFGREVAPAFT
jgi:alkanesulfonate monooxygenase SsuD/methylene tetrahydromethanopterin reductase-like flavin-dependent oxidoreductase (luciferase family)